MNTKYQFLEERRPEWQQLETLLKKGSLRGRRHWTSSEVSAFARGLRAVAQDLAVVRAHDWGRGLVDYLNDLAMRGHHALYGRSSSSLTAAVAFLTRDFPRLFRRHAGYFTVAAALFFIPLAVTWAAVQTDPTLALRVLPAEQLDTYDTMYRGTVEAESDAGQSADPSLFEEERAAMAGFYVQHNVGIALQCFSRGVLLGLGTITTLLFNGVIIGGVAGYVLSLGHGERFLSFVVSHGSFELTAIAMAGGAGLLLGDAWAHPGQRTRLESLRVQGMEAVQIAGGAAVMLVIAAMIEAFWSPAPFPSLVKFVVGGLLWVAVALYLTLSGRER